MSRRWVLHHVVAACQDCDWVREQHGPDDQCEAYVVAAGRLHARRRGHYVQVERGQHAHYDGRRPA